MTRGFARRQVHRSRHRPRRVERSHLGAMVARPFCADAAERDPPARQPLIGIVGAQRQPIFGARREHAIRLADAAGHQIVDHDAEIAFGAIEDDRRAPPRSRRGIETGDQALRRSLLIAGGAVDLARQEQPRQALGLQRRRQLARIDMVVFDGIARPHDAGALQPGNGGHQRRLDVLRQRGRDAVRIDRRVVEPFRLEKNLVPVALAEAHDLVLDRRAIARTAALDLAGIHRRAMHIGANDFMGRRRRAGDAALDLRIGDALGQHRERLRRIVPRLHFQRRPVDRARRRAAAAYRS